MNYVFPSGYSWQHFAFSEEVSFPVDKAVRAGRDADGSIIYIGRAFHEGDMIPAKIIPDKHAAFVAYGGEEHAKFDFEFLRTGDFVWEFATNGEVPEGAVSVGRTADGEVLYMGRCLHCGTQTPGKVTVVVSH